jgi:hypothetical protein
MARLRADDEPGWAEFLAPNALLAGAVASFLGCCGAGFLADRHNPFERFGRFHASLTPESLFYPTAGQVRALARSLLPPDKIAVVIGGSSRLHGTGQPAGSVWTNRLQAELGDEFRVLNLALRCGASSEFGQAVAEMLSAEYPRLIFITDAFPGGGMSPRPDGHCYRYFYWDAFYKGLLPPAPHREALLRKLDQGEENAELKRRMRLDSVCYFTGLWNWLGYRHLFTVWMPHNPGWFTRPRRSLDDSDPGPLPLDRRFPGPALGEWLSRLRAMIDSVQVVGDGAVDWPDYRELLHGLFPGPLRPRVLLVLPRVSVYHLAQLRPKDRRTYTWVCAASVRATEAAGVAALEVGEGFAQEDYADFLHLSPSGGDKLAVRVATKVRQRARALGFIP